MRCNNCGWDNTPGSSSCVKCGHSLGGGNYNSSALQEPSLKATVIGAANRQEPPSRPTVIGAAGMGMQAPPSRPTRIGNAPNPAAVHSQGGSSNCPNCGYPVAGGSGSCPNCGTPIATPVASAKPKSADFSDLGVPDHVICDKCGTEVSTQFSFCPKCGGKIHMPTVRAIRHRPQQRHCSLTIIPEEDENIPEQRNVYNGDNIILTRENTEQDNRTITSKEQAELSFEDGKWYILNKSEYGSTYIEANRKFEIQQGDVIVLGDRRFRFDTE